ncbi:cytochrome-c oxidase [Acididesulfobacillus acetoxydans]|uniref:Cytochrome-c oxidase n=1 Tax=Acididesulfobacillus acetoxydans TaxID=1561005 RepID=A0A8S0WEF1_9FIRM|nr:Sec-dependent nitrous-oxide reductase [Acididesulfobacillus acetoxydans]CAA7600062.1 cytochrome-c oxidase [Acididesulfobacillus acetoxydans]CEJ07837.1 Nitrous-oxide reductase [Acididesulfobacillus acetoxydans]
MFERQWKNYKGLAIMLIIGLIVGVAGGKLTFDSASQVQTNSVVSSNEGWVPPGQLDQAYMFASGGQSGNMVVFGIPSMRILKTIPVFDPFPDTGYGFTPATKKMLGKYTWGDAHHPVMSQTKGTYDGQFVWVNDKANDRIGQVDLRTFTTTQILNVPNLMGLHSLSTDPESKYLFTASEFSAPVANGKPNYAPLNTWGHQYYGVAACVNTNREGLKAGQPGKMGLDYEMLLPPYDYDLASVGKADSAGYVFYTSYNSEEATTDLEKNSTKFDRDLTLFMDYKAAQKLIDAGKYDAIINGVKVIDPRKHPGIAWLLPIPKNPHGVDVSPDGKWICYSSKLDPVVTVISMDKLKQAIAHKDYEKTTWGLPVIKWQDVQEAQIPVGVGPLHTQFDNQGYAYTSLFVESAVTKWQLGTWKVIDKQPVNYNVGHVAVAGGDSEHPFGHWLVALDKMSLNRFLPVGPGYPVTEQLFDISKGPKMQLVNEAPSDREPHYATIIPANLIHPLNVYPKDTARPNSTWNEAQAKVVRNGKEVKVYMTAVRSHFVPDNIEVNQGDHVDLYLTNIEQQPNITHGLAISKYNINLAADPGETVRASFTADKAGTFPFYCTDFCSALHEEMMGYLLVKPHS